MNKKYTHILSALIGIAVLASLAACSTPGRTPLRNNPGGINEQVGYTPAPNPATSPTIGNLLGENNSAGLTNRTPGTATTSPQYPANRPMGFDMQKSDNLVNQMGNIDGAGQISTVVNGNTALVSYKPTGTATNANAVKDAIAAKIRQTDRSITSIAVSDSEDVAAKMKQLADEIKSGRGSSESVNRFNQLVQSVSPLGMPER